MKPWDVKKTVKTLRQMNGEQTLLMGSELNAATIEILYDSIRAQNPRIKRKKLLEEAQKIIWNPIRTKL